MFLITAKEEHTNNKKEVSGGARRYAQLYSRLLGDTPKITEFDLGPLSLTVLHTRPEQLPILVQSAEKSVAVLGHVSRTASDGNSVTEFLHEALAREATLDEYIRSLQGDYVIVLVDQNNQWQCAVDAVGLGRLYLYSQGLSFLMSDTLYLLAACLSLEIDPVGVYGLDICRYHFGHQTIYKNVRLLEMGNQVSGTENNWQLAKTYHFADAGGPDVDARDVAVAYLDVASPRFAATQHIRHCTSGGTDSRVVLALMSALNGEPEVFCYRWDKNEVRIAQALANELGLDFHSIGKNYLLGGSSTTGDAHYHSWLTELFVLDGGLSPPFTSKNYLFNLPPGALVTKGSFGESTIKSTWGVGYAGMRDPQPEAVIDRLMSVSIFRKKHDGRLLRNSQAYAEMRRYVADILHEQAQVVQGVDHVKLCNYFYLRNRGARWAAQLLQASNRISRMDCPLAYTRGVEATWRMSSYRYNNLQLVRELLAILEPRLATMPFHDGSPAHVDLNFADQIQMKFSRKFKKGWHHFVVKRLLDRKAKDDKGNMRPNGLVKAVGRPYIQMQADFVSNSDVVKEIYALDRDQETSLHRLAAAGHINTVYTLAFAGQIHEGFA